MLASVTQANFEKIKTWDGHITKEELLTIRDEQASKLLKRYTDIEPNDSVNEIQIISNRTIQFEINTENNQFFSSSEYTGPRLYMDTKRGKVYPSSQWSPEESKFIVTSENQVEIAPLSCAQTIILF